MSKQASNNQPKQEQGYRIKLTEEFHIVADPNDIQDVRDKVNQAIKKRVTNDQGFDFEYDEVDDF